MLILAFVGWVIAYVAKVVLRSFLRLIKFDKLSEKAGASQLLTKAALPSATEMLSRFVFWVVWLGFILLGVSVLGILGLQEQIARFFLFLPRLFVAHVHHVFRTAGSGFLFSRCPVGRGKCECAFTPGFEPSLSAASSLFSYCPSPLKNWAWQNRPCWSHLELPSEP